jgi:N4-gp56 family major capsid protein
MAETILNSALAVSRWRRDYFKDYVRASRFRPYMGRGKDNIIITMYELQSEAGKTINVPFISALNGAGVSGSQVLEGNEEELVTANMPISVDWRRNGVVVPKSESYKTEIDLLDAARDELRRWEANLLRADIIREFGAVTTAAGVSIPYASATEPEKDAWLALNADRIIFGKDVSNNSANDHSASLANIDTTNDKATAALLTKVKRRMKAAKITPYMTTDGREYFVWFVGSRAFRDLSEDASILAANRDARERNVDTNPIFQGGDLIYQGVIIREEEEIPVLAGVGASSSDVEPSYMAGSGAIGVAWGQEPTPKTDRDRDYGFRPGVAIEELLGVKKINEDGVQRGVHTVYVSAAADA